MISTPITPNYAEDYFQQNFQFQAQSLQGCANTIQLNTL